MPGRPTVFSSTSGGSSGTVPVMLDDSVHAYRTTIGAPSRVRIFSASSGVTGADPVLQMRNADSSAVASSGSSTNFAHCVGTPCPPVTRSRTMMSSISPADHGTGINTQLMTNSTWSQILFM